MKRDMDLVRFWNSDILTGNQTGMGSVVAEACFGTVTF